MKKVFLSIVASLFIVGISLAQTVVNNTTNKKTNSEEIKIEDIPLKVKASVMKEAILVKNLKHSSREKKNGVYVYTFIIKEGKEKYQYRYDDQGKLLKKMKWEGEKDR
ncbi:hypothetical protein JKA74_01180 [Marivirga sp. S37H4]|uniref:PepSY domain-containing protein n=1 Tax=Marivirga aurantiaca TaxID=2802615 RepID=A0A934WVH9_9BACT|nr:hypothetical protein [Marivirga aurantiaca]MBK6263630.1 hypothetical protein [Marivirga aurantiaca]